MSEELKQFMEYKGSIGSLWYIATPYTHPDPKVVEKRVKDTEDCVVHIIKSFHDVVPFSPILYSLSLQRSGIENPSREGWYAFGLAFLRKADRVVVMEFDGWESSIGVALEIAFAKAKGLPISYYTKERLLTDDIPF